MILIAGLTYRTHDKHIWGIAICSDGRVDYECVECGMKKSKADRKKEPENK